MIPRIHASTAPHRPAIVLADTGEQVSWSEVEARSAALATWLHGGDTDTGESAQMGASANT